MKEDAVAVPAMQVSTNSIRWYNLRDKESRQSSVVVHANWSLDGIFADNAARQSHGSSVEFEYSAIAALLVLGSPAA